MGVLQYAAVVPLVLASVSPVIADSPMLYSSGTGHCYQRVDAALTFNAAAGACRTRGASLVTIADEGEDTFVFDQLIASGMWPWLGGTDEGSEGSWRWVTGEPWSYAPWYPGEPNNQGGVEHYLAYFDTSTPLWNDVPDGPLPYICEWEVCPPMVVAIGDSCTSGEGAGAYAIDWNRDGDVLDIVDNLAEDTDRSANRCHRSSAAWSGSAPGASPGAAAPSPTGARSWTLAACSGARIKDLEAPFSANHGGRNPDEVAQLEHLDSITGEAIVVMTIGGNDVGFAPLLTACAALPSGMCLMLGARVSVSVARLYTAPDGLVNILRQVKARPTQPTPVLVLGYPRVMTTNSLAGPECALFSLDERLLFAGLTDELDLALECAAAQAGVHFVPVSFSGHEACTLGQPLWINGLQLPVVESFHPNRRGQVAYARALNQYLGGSIPHNPAPVDPAHLDPACDQLGRAPRSADAIGALTVTPAVPSTCDSADTFVPGDSIGLHGGGYDAGTAITLELVADQGAYSAPLPSVAADQAGRIDVERTIPPDAPTAGLAALLAEGAGAQGGVLTLLGTISLAASSSADTDGDGIPDLCDTCPSIANPDQQDGDGDRRGDACDPCPADRENDWDDDGLCADADPCPLDPYNDLDGDGVCGEIDTLHVDSFESGDLSGWSSSTP